MLNNNFKIIFIHGYTSSSTSDWYPNISRELTRLGIDFVVPDLPGGEHPHASTWLEELRKVILKVDKPLVLVGHSLGTRTALLYLEKYKPQVEAVFLIAAFANRLENAHKYDGDGYPDFFEHEIDIQKIKSLAKKFVVIHSKDDPLDYEQGVEIAKDLGAKLIAQVNRGHMSEPENANVILEVVKAELHV